MRRIPFTSIAVGFAIFGAGIGGFFLLTQSKPTADVRDVPAAVWRVSTQTIELQTVSPVFNGFGSVQNPDTQTLKARIATDVAALHVREGARTEAGRVLIELDATDAEIKLSQAEANLADAKANLIALNMTESKDR